MLNKTEYLLICLIEECAEIQQRATKALRFGLTEIQKDQLLTNAQRINGEVNDFNAVLEILKNRRDIPEQADDEEIKAIMDKHQKLHEYGKLSIELGILKEEL